MEQKQLDLEKILFAVEPLHQVKEEIIPLLEKHWEELEWIKTHPLNPDWDKYESLDRASLLVIMTAREEGVLIGYNVFIVHQSMHYKNLKAANQDLIYIAPERRGFGTYFIHWSEGILKELGVDRVYYHTKAVKDFGEKILLPQGYALVDQVYGKEIS